MRHLSPFWRHFLEMLAAMVVGMLVTGAIFLSIVGLKTWDEVTLQYLRSLCWRWRRAYSMAM